MELQELGIYCGTFNPIHWGHLLIAECALSQFRLDKVIFVTSGIPPHRRAELLPGEARHELVVAAVSDNPHFEVSRCELDRPGPSFTSDTLKELRQTYKLNVRLNLIVGGDNIQHMGEWHEASEIFRLARILVAPRLFAQFQETDTGLNLDLDRGEHAETAIIEFPAFNISSSSIRQRIRQGKSILYMVPFQVNQLIAQRGYYQPLPEKPAVERG